MRKIGVCIGLSSMLFAATAFAQGKVEAQDWSDGPNTGGGSYRIQQRLQNVPNSTTRGSPLIQGDEWSFYGYQGDTVTLSVNTRDDFGNGRSGLDPVMVLKDEDDNVVAFADDNMICDANAVPVCGYACPRIVVTLPRSGRFTIVVRDFDTASTTGIQCTGGSYLLTVDGPHTVRATLSRAPTIDNGIVGDPPWLQEQLQSTKPTAP